MTKLKMIESMTDLPVSCHLERIYDQFSHLLSL
jgi:hypothetical protein